MKMQDLAKQALEQFKTNEIGRIVLTDDRQEWIHNMVYESHNGMLPDDYKYKFTVDALTLIAESDLDTDLEELGYQIEADIYSHDLLQWVASNLTRSEYVDQAVEECHVDTENFQLFRALGVGQQLERQEVFSAVLNALEIQLDNQ